jgi:hypothetical protein
MRSEPPLRTKKQKPIQTIESKNTRDDKKMNRHPKNKTTKAENTKLYSLLTPLTLVWSAAAASTPKEKASHNERKNNESIN